MSGSEDELFSDEDSVGPNQCSTDITFEEAKANYERVGSLMESDESSLKWESYQSLYNEQVKRILDEVYNEMKLPKLSEFQEMFLHSIGSKKDVFAIVNTGSGKTEASGIAALVLRKVFDEPRGLVVMFVPLTGILYELIEHDKVSTAAVTMDGQMFGKNENGEGRVILTEEDILSGKFARIVMHPESLKIGKVEMMMLKLKQRQQVLGAFIDEFHTILPKHWASFRPGMEEETARLRVFLRKGAPTGALSATSTRAEIDATVLILGLREKPVILAECPLQEHYKFVMLKRPSDNYGFEGFIDKNNKFHAGLLEQLKVVYLDEYINSISENREPKHGIIFFRTESQLILVLNFLRQSLSVSNVNTAPFVSLVASTPQVTELVIRKRGGSISLFLTTQKMLMGLNIPKLQICIFVKPMNMLHSLLQGAGRAGRPLVDEPGKRARALVYILANGGDVGAQVKGMSDEVRVFVNYKSGCLKAFLADYFIGDMSFGLMDPDWCCSFCSAMSRSQLQQS